MIERINKLGWNATENEVIKNGVKKIGITFGKEGDVIMPTIYPTPEMDTWTDDELKTELENIYNSTPKIETECLTNEEFILDNLVLCLQQKGNEDIVKKDFLDLEMYIRVKINSEMSYKLKPGMVKDMDIDTLFEQAKSNLEAEIKNISEMIPVPEQMPMWVLSNSSGTNGASSMLQENVLNQFCEEHNIEEVVIIPSSIHEVILLEEVNNSIKGLCEMIQEVNETQLKPEEILSNHPYKYSKEEGYVWTM